MNTQATRGLSSGEDRSSQWATGGTRLSVTLVLQPGFSGQDRIPEAMDVLWASRNSRDREIPENSSTISVLITKRCGAEIRKAEIEPSSPKLFLS